MNDMTPAPISVERLRELLAEQQRQLLDVSGQLAITDVLVTEMRKRAEAAESKLAERDAEVGRLNAECKQHLLQALENGAAYQAAERARDEANKMWREAFIGVVQAALTHAGMEIEQANISANEKADRIAAYLAENGGGRA